MLLFGLGLEGLFVGDLLATDFTVLVYLVLVLKFFVNLDGSDFLLGWVVGYELEQVGDPSLLLR